MNDQPGGAVLLLDIETTGSAVADHRPVSIGAALVAGGSVVGVQSWLIRQSRAVLARQHPAAKRVHGLIDSAILGAALDEEASAAQLQGWLASWVARYGAVELSAYNVSFDGRWLKSPPWSLQEVPGVTWTTCALRRYRELVVRPERWVKGARLGVASQWAAGPGGHPEAAFRPGLEHDAGEDARVSAWVWLALDALEASIDDPSVREISGPRPVEGRQRLPAVPVGAEVQLSLIGAGTRGAPLTSAPRPELSIHWRRSKTAPNVRLQDIPGLRWRLPIGARERRRLDVQAVVDLYRLDLRARERARPSLLRAHPGQLQDNRRDPVPPGAQIVLNVTASELPPSARPEDPRALGAALRRVLAAFLCRRGWGSRRDGVRVDGHRYRVTRDRDGLPALASGMFAAPAWDGLGDVPTVIDVAGATT